MRATTTGKLMAAAAGLAIALGTLAIVSDAIPGPLGRVLLLLASTGPAWGIAATLAGARAPSWPLAACAGGVVMVGAVIMYYGLAGALGLRPAVDWTSLRDAGTVWGALGLVAGPSLGALGWHAVRAEGRARSVLWGVLGGAFLSQAVYLMPRTSDGVRELFRGELAALALLLLLGLTIPIVVVVVGSRRQHLIRGLLVMTVVGMAGAVAWAFLQKLV